MICQASYTDVTLFLQCLVCVYILHYVTSFKKAYTSTSDIM